ncbi:olfactory receptor 6M1-like [Denticeps clupeoides]|uniref:olfactory receptor 6M1-like n=1 Tax=Denticeps clupeoides TaxID=299321 RepID=UPI0010A3FAB8|nr:olfactory receptor 6M1-like [Denticeps clupeoides]
MNPANGTVSSVSELTIIGFDHLSHQKLIGSLIIITYFLVLICTTTNLSLIVSDRHLHTPMCILICNLSIVDIIFSTSCSPIMISVLLSEIKTISLTSCVARMYIHHVADVTECLALTLMALDRMIAIISPLRYHSILTNSRTIILIVLSWLLAMGVLIPLITTIRSLPYCQPFIKYVFCDYATLLRTACVNPEPYFLYPVILSLWLLGGHFSFIFLTYVVIIVTVLRLANRQSRKKMFSTCISHIIVCMSFYGPKLVSILLTRIGVALTLTERNAVVTIAAMLPPLINPFTYCLTTKQLRERLIKLLTRNRVASVK